MNFKFYFAQKKIKYKAIYIYIYVAHILMEDITYPIFKFNCHTFNLAKEKKVFKKIDIK